MKIVLITTTLVALLAISLLAISLLGISNSIDSKSNNIDKAFAQMDS